MKDVVAITTKDSNPARSSLLSKTSPTAGAAQALQGRPGSGRLAEELPGTLADRPYLGGVAAAVPAPEEMQTDLETPDEAGALQVLGGDGARDLSAGQHVQISRSLLSRHSRVRLRRR